MRLEELRKKYLEFFRQQKHAVIASASLLPEHDPTVLFTTAGMHPLVPYLLGQPHPQGRRLADCQKCIRTTDIDSVGDTSHLTFFEMLGNWSLGDYWKKEAITWSYEFLTSKKWLGLNPKQLSVTVFAGDADAPKDDESAKTWMGLGIPAERVYFLPKDDNWWGPAGKTGPCGPCTEMFMENSKIPKCGPDCRPGCKCGHFLEIWNDVFMQYDKKEDSSYELLKQKNVDTGMGLERTGAILSGVKSVYDTEAFIPLVNKIKELSGNEKIDESNEKLVRTVADHVKAAVMIMADDRRISPSNVEHGYIVRRLIRKAIRSADDLGIPEGFLVDLATIVIDMYKDVYDEVQRNRDFVMQNLEAEERKFRSTLGKALRKFEQTLKETGTITGKDAFVLFTSFGLPLEMTAELASERGIKIDIDEFRREFEQHQDTSRTATEGKFKSGLADNTEEITKLHTATHLLQAALRKVLGESVRQNGSNITEERLRFDFTFSRKLTPEELQRVEGLVNDAIRRDLKVTRQIMKVDEAVKGAALAFFRDTYDDEVSVYTLGDFSKEVCAGPHVEHTGVLKHFRITKQDNIGAGLMRIRAVLDEE
jgi:alanyl-tRNA synthetase